MGGVRGAVVRVRDALSRGATPATVAASAAMATMASVSSAVAPRMPVARAVRVAATCAKAAEGHEPEAGATENQTDGVEIHCVGPGESATPPYVVEDGVVSGRTPADVLNGVPPKRVRGGGDGFALGS